MRYLAGYVGCAIIFVLLMGMIFKALVLPPIFARKKRFVNTNQEAFYLPPKHESANNHYTGPYLAEQLQELRRQRETPADVNLKYNASYGYSNVTFSLHFCNDNPPICRRRGPRE